jgi:hypothetical protein
MTVNRVKLSIECQLKNQTNYVKNNSIRICNDALKIDYLCVEKIHVIKSLKKGIEEIEDPWQWNGIPSRKETELILEHMIALKIVLERKASL